MDEKGMTLMELLVVVAIVATIAGIVMLSSAGLRQTYAVKAAAREIFGDMQRARMAAIREGRKYLICFSPGNNGFTNYSVRKFGANTTNCDADDEVVFSKDLSSLYRGMAFEEHFSGTALSFMPIGTASSGDVQVISSKATKTVTVNPATGNVRIQ